MISKLYLFEEMNEHLLMDEKPSTFFKNIPDNTLSEYPYSFLNNLKKVPQSPKHHPEGNVWNHTMLVVDEAAQVKHKSNNKSVFMWAALLHDIGKADATRNRKGKITAYDHDKIGAKQAKEFLEEFTDDENFIEAVSMLVRWHMQILFVVKSMHFADINSMRQQVDVKEVALLGYCDRMGRTNADEREEINNIDLFLKKCGADPIFL